MGLVYFSFHNSGYRAVLSVEEQGIAIKPGKLYLQPNVQYTFFFYSSYWSTLNIHINWHFSSLILYYQFLFDILFNFFNWLVHYGYSSSLAHSRAYIVSEFISATVCTGS